MLVFGTNVYWLFTGEGEPDTHLVGPVISSHSNPFSLLSAIVLITVFFN